MKYYFNENKINKIIKLFIEENKSSKEIGKIFGVGSTFILKKLKENNINTRLKGRKNLKNRNEKNGMWKGNKVKITPLHKWIKRRKPKTEFCEKCKKNKPKDLANISGKYLRDINDFEWLCRSCHMKKDGRINNLKQFKKN